MRVGEVMTDRPSTKGGVTVAAWLPPVIFAVITGALFRAFVFTDEMLYGGDTLSLGYAARALYAEALAALGRVPRWAPHLLGGTPFIEALSGGDSLYPPSVLLLMLAPPHRALGWKLVLHIFLAGIFFYSWIRAVGGSRAAGLLGGVAYMLAPFLVGFIHPGHDGKHTQGSCGSSTECKDYISSMNDDSLALWKRGLQACAKAGMEEAIGFKLYSLAGGLAPHTDFTYNSPEPDADTDAKYRIKDATGSASSTRRVLPPLRRGSRGAKAVAWL